MYVDFVDKMFICIDSVLIYVDLCWFIFI